MTNVVKQIDNIQLRKYADEVHVFFKSDSILFFDSNTMKLSSGQVNEKEMDTINNGQIKIVGVDEI